MMMTRVIVTVTVSPSRTGLAPWAWSGADGTVPLALAVTARVPAARPVALAP